MMSHDESGIMTLADAIDVALEEEVFGGEEDDQPPMLEKSAEYAIFSFSLLYWILTCILEGNAHVEDHGSTLQRRSFSGLVPDVWCHYHALDMSPTKRSVREKRRKSTTTTLNWSVLFKCTCT